MKLEFGYGAGVQTVDVPDANLDAVLISNPFNDEEKYPQYSLDKVREAFRLL